MGKLSNEAWAEGFDDLRGRPERYILCDGTVAFDVATNVTPDHGPGVVIRLSLPDGRAALCGLDLVGAIDALIDGAHHCGLRVVIGLAQPLQPPAQGLN